MVAATVALAVIAGAAGCRVECGHQVVLLAPDEHSASLHDPVREDGAAITYDRAALLANWKGTASVIHRRA
ncbi:MAG: hypothetical protein QOF69_3661 [Solirubrobacteraceae bacterium]|nr:hypothetical protein [Solirubrobacteraceae bacterium]